MNIDPVTHCAELRAEANALFASLGRLTITVDDPTTISREALPMLRLIEESLSEACATLADMPSTETLRCVRRAIAKVEQFELDRVVGAQ